MDYLKFIIKSFIKILYPSSKKNIFICLRLSITFLINEFIFQIFKKKYIHYEHKHRKFIKENLSFHNNQDWFSHNICYWHHAFIKKLPNKKISILEIGNYEGNSTVFLLKEIPNSTIECVDSFSPYNKLQSGKDYDVIYNNFLSNTSPYKERVTIFKMKSNEFFSLKIASTKDFKNEKYDLIYIDGSHIYADVLNDANSAINLLNKNGVLIFDDFLWMHYPKINDNPMGAIKKFLESNIKNLKIISISHQIIFQKIN